MPVSKRKRRTEPQWTIIQRKLLAVLEQQEHRTLGPGAVCKLAGYADWAGIGPPKIRVLSPG
ncbi:MAG TPA: hypothetical protein VFN02_08710 [Ktedonobacteraceae bacterium]|nr:hypothetical protein [Ktedonobacteraceae bacterium]